MPPETDFERESRGVAPIDDKDEAKAADKHTEKQLDHGLKETFPASDPVSINPGAD